MLHFVAPAVNRPEHERSARSRLAWAVTSVVGIAYSCAVSTTFPFFSTVVAIIAALGDLAGAYALPALFVLVTCAAFLITPAGLNVACWYDLTPWACSAA